MAAWATAGWLPGEGKPRAVDIVCLIGDRLYHAPGSPCHRALEAQSHGASVLTLTDAMAYENGMEPCGACLGDCETEGATPKKA